MEKHLVFTRRITTTAYKQMKNETVANLWRRFTLDNITLDIVPCDAFVFQIGSVSPPTLEDDREYTLTVTPDGLAIIGKDYGGLMRGFFSLLMKIEQRGSDFVIGCTEESSGYLLKNRMIHLCVFPENDANYMKKLIRLAALCQYTHVVIEFWGTLQYDCLKELSWPNAFTKDEVREWIRECRELGMEPIPMFNQLGHATEARAYYGKHVVLDQNPKLQRLYTPDGWAWNIESEEVRLLLKAVRHELYELFGEGSYLHIGCDEAYFISANEDLRKQLPAYLGNLTHEVESEGRRPMMWMDMLLEKGVFPHCYTVGEKDEVEAIRNATAPSTVFVDWQYDCFETPIPSLASLKHCGHDVIGAPWYDDRNFGAHIETVVEHELFGIMLTTWHTLKDRMISLLCCAKRCGAVSFTWSQYATPFTETATLLRYLSWEKGTYSDYGWAKEQIEV